MNNKTKRKYRVTNKIKGINRPMLRVFRSNKHIYAQISDPALGKTVVGVSDMDLSKKDDTKTKMERAELVGEKIALLAKKAKIKNVVFNRGMYKYHGRVKALAQKARENGLNF